MLLQGSNTIKQIHLAQNRTNKKQELLMECLTKASQSTTLKVDLSSSGIDLGVIGNQHSTFRIQQPRNLPLGQGVVQKTIYFDWWKKKIKKLDYFLGELPKRVG